MKHRFKQYFRLHLWLLCAAGCIVFFHVGKQSRPLMNLLADGVTEPLKRALGHLCALVPFSVAEVLIAAGLGCGVLYLAAAAAAVLRAEHRKKMLYVCTLAFLNTILTIYALFCLLWGVNYYTDSFQDKSGIVAQPVSVAQLQDVTARFAAAANEYSNAVERDKTGLFAVPRDTIYAAATEIYAPMEELYPFLAMRDEAPKRVSFSKLMSATNFTGFFFPFTGETNLNDDSPACILPATIAHELAHRRGIASEQECNFLAVLVCENSGNVVYEYSGALFAYIHLSNALYRADREAWDTVRGTLNEAVLRDLQANNAYWAQFEGKTAEVSKKTYDSFLKGYGDSDGIQSYGAVVDLLVTYYAAA